MQGGGGGIAVLNVPIMGRYLIGGKKQNIIPCGKKGKKKKR